VGELIIVPSALSKGRYQVYQLHSLGLFVDTNPHPRSVFLHNGHGSVVVLNPVLDPVSFRLVEFQGLVRVVVLEHLSDCAFETCFHKGEKAPMPFHTAITASNKALSLEARQLWARYKLMCAHLDLYICWQVMPGAFEDSR